MRTLIVVCALLLHALPAEGQDDVTKLATVDVPNVVTLTLSEAQRAFRARNLRSTAVRIDGGTATAGDIVVRQSPAANQKVSAGTVCTVYVRPPSEQVPPPEVQLTPRVIGLPLSDASVRVILAKLIPRIARVPSPDTALGSVIRQDPPPDTPIRPDRTIDLEIAGVPQVVGLATGVAVARLERARLAATTSIREQTTGNDGTVLAQFPRAGQIVMPGTAVALTVVRVVQPPFAMPELVGQPIANARRMIAESGLVLQGMEIANVEGRPDTAVGQSPVAGAIVRRGDPVTLTSGRPITAVEVPSVIRLRSETAKSVLAARGLELVPAGASQSELSVGSVVRQRPAAGTLVPRGTSVSVDTAIAVVPPTVAVPNFVGARINRVPRMPEARSLQIRARYAAPTRDSEDSVVVAQSLSVGARVPIGSAITLTVSQRQRARLASLRIEPESVSIAAHDSVRLTVVGVMSDGSRIAVAPSWAATMGRITSDGRYFATGETGRVVVAAAFGGVATTSIIRVKRGPLPWWWIPVIAVVVASLGWGVWRLIDWWRRPPTPPTPPVPPLAFTYDFKAPSIDTEITVTEGHGSNLSLVSYAGESVHALEPAGVELFDEENIHG